ncbi:hypothetical protein LCGC14_2725460 [marine sediment metagenome]|uniref:Uncharacterized protein n=1 Tax=marine sediment metagenome TaxID=412755 RepID=A0A0F8Z8T7_9ZZZZ
MLTDPLFWNGIIRIALGLTVIIVVHRSTTVNADEGLLFHLLALAIMLGGIP